MVNEIEYKKSQLVVDQQGQIWVLVDIVESISLLSESKKPLMTAYLRPKSKKKVSKTSYQNFVNLFTPFLSTDKDTVDKIMSLEEYLEIDGIHSTSLES